MLTEEQYIELEEAIMANPEQFNKEKALEEFTEFIEAVLKYSTKHPDNPKRPTPDDILEEYTHAVMRGGWYIHSLFKDNDEVVEKMDGFLNKKSEQLHGWLKKGLYKGGL